MPTLVAAQLLTCLAASGSAVHLLNEPSVDIMLSSASDVTPGSLVSVDIEISLKSNHDVDGFTLALAYDTAAMQFYSYHDYGLEDDCGWFFGFKLLPLDTLPTDSFLVRIVAKNTSDTDCFGSGSRKLRFDFQTKGNVALYGTATDVAFYWMDCHDNVLWTDDHDTAMLAVAVEDADGHDITDSSRVLPSATGPHASCTTEASRGDTVAVKAVRFRSGRIEFRVPTAVGDPPTDATRPDGVALDQNYPNPFNASTVIEFYLPLGGEWRLEILNVQGQAVRRFMGHDGAGAVRVAWDGCDSRGRAVASGVYLYRLVVGKFGMTRKMLLVR